MKLPITTFLIDDEEAAHYALHRLMKNYSDLLTVVGEAYSGREAVSGIESLRPQLLFMDIRMPDMNGFEVLSRLSYQPYVIFSTAYDQYAIEAFQENLIDYLLKPVEEARFGRCMDKLRRMNHLGASLDTDQLTLLFDRLTKPRKATAIPIHVKGKIILVRCPEIAYCEARDGYVSLFTLDGKEYVTDLTLSQLEERLPDAFLRVQKSFIVNKEKIEEIHKYFNNRLILILEDKAHTRITTGTSYIATIRKELDL